MSLGDKIKDTLSDTVCTLLGIEESHAYLEQIQVHWNIKLNDAFEGWKERNQAMSLKEQCKWDLHL